MTFSIVPISSSDLEPNCQTLNTQGINSIDAAIIIRRSAIVRSGCYNQALTYSKTLAANINRSYEGKVFVRVMQESFGQRFTLHWLIHFAEMTTPQQYADLDEWGTGHMFVDGSAQEKTLTPIVTSKTMPTYGARNQTKLIAATSLHSLNAGAIIHRSGKMNLHFLPETKAFSLAVAECINAYQDGRVSVFLFEELGGEHDRLHWLIHMQDTSSYYALIDMRAAMTPEVAEVYQKQWIPEHKGGGDWTKMFLPASLSDLCIEPLDELKETPEGII